MYRPVEYRKDFKFSRIKRPNEREDEDKTKKKEEKKHDFFFLKITIVMNIRNSSEFLFKEDNHTPSGCS